MKLLAHRGAWRTEAEKNTLASIARALDYNWGFESDLRDYGKHLVISHNVPESNAPAAEQVFRLMSDKGRGAGTFAINIKSDGLTEMLMEALEHYQITSYFCFDMSVPQMLEYQEKRIRFFTRQSEYEQTPLFYEEAAGVWIDAFEREDWITPELLRGHIDAGKAISIVSPELHQRDPYGLWSVLHQMDLSRDDIYLCTDKPEEAEAYFHR